MNHLLNGYITLVVMSQSKHFKVDFLEKFWLSGPMAFRNCYLNAQLSVCIVPSFTKMSLQSPYISCLPIECRREELGPNIDHPFGILIPVEFYLKIYSVP